jgi:hypothetical protein
MKTVTYDAWAALVVSGQESGDRQPCRLTIEVPDDKSRRGEMALDRKLSFEANRPGMASVVFFDGEQSCKSLMEWAVRQAMDSGWTVSLIPDPTSPLED